MLPVAEPTVIFQRVQDGAVLFAPGTEIYFGLNEVGSRVWELLPPSCETLDDLSARLAAAYPDVPLQTIREDVEELLAELVREGLLIPRDGERPADGDARG